MQFIETTDDPGTYVLHLLVMDAAPHGRPVTIRAAMAQARAERLLQQPHLEVVVDPADPANVSLPGA